jgi:hypothetical protein
MIDMPWMDRKQYFAKPVPDWRFSWSNTDLRDKQRMVSRLLLPPHKDVTSLMCTKKGTINAFFPARRKNRSMIQ